VIPALVTRTYAGGDDVYMARDDAARRHLVAFVVVDIGCTDIGIMRRFGSPAVNLRGPVG
jgi:hypothetical protein